MTERRGASEPPKFAAPLQLAKYLLIAAVTSMAATMAAVHVYGVIAWHERLFAFDIGQAVLFGFPFALRGLALSLPAAAVLFSVRTRLSNASFVALTTVAGILLGVILGLYLPVNADHVSTVIAAEALAWTWGIAAFLVSLFRLRRA